jgi:hypothetical protein
MSSTPGCSDLEIMQLTECQSLAMNQTDSPAPRVNQSPPDLEVGCVADGGLGAQRYPFVVFWLIRLCM